MRRHSEIEFKIISELLQWVLTKSEIKESQAGQAKQAGWLAIAQEVEQQLLELNHNSRQTKRARQTDGPRDSQLHRCTLTVI